MHKQKQILIINRDIAQKEILKRATAFIGYGILLMLIYLNISKLSK